MPDRQDHSGLFGLNEPDPSYYHSTSTAAHDDNNNLVAACDDQQLFEGSQWTFQATPPYDTFEGNPFFGDEWSLNQQMPLPASLAPQQPITQPLSMPTSSMEFGQSGMIPAPAPIVPTDGMPSRPVILSSAINGLTAEQRQQLQQIAMPAGVPYRSPKSESSPDSTGNGKSSPSSSPEGMRDMGKSNNRKRKSSADDDDDDDDDDNDFHQPIKKTAHNMIEKRYRTNLNDKIAALRDSVPSLRIISKSARGEDTTEDREELHGLTPAHKLNKATVLSKATEYIRHLEKRNTRLLNDNAVMQQRIFAFEKLFMSGAMNNAISPQQQPQHQPPPTPVSFPQSSGAYVVSPMATPSQADPQSMMQVPDEMKQIMSAQIAAGQPYPVSQQSFRQNPALVRQQRIQQQHQAQARGWQNAGPYFGKLMVGSLAGLMLLEAVRENEQNNDTPDGRGLFALPIHLLRFLTSGLDIHFMGYFINGSHVFYSIKVVLLLCSIWWALLPSLMDSQPPNPKTATKLLAPLKAAPSLASPIHVRQQAWLTAIQTVWVPRHNFFLEAAALGLKTLKLSIRNLIGVHGYQMLTGLTEEQELARVKAWAIALDAQLAGGDVDISKSRLTLTLLASGTLPTTPLRLMLKSLHIRVLLWEGNSSRAHTGPINAIAAKIARSSWNEARQLHRLLNQLRHNGQTLPEDDLPDHLAALLEQDCDDVLNSSIIQRAHNLAWNRLTEYNAFGNTDGMATVVEDQAVRSPMDAIAAWWSTMTLQNALTTSLLDAEDQEGDLRHHVEPGVSLAIRTAPVGSVTQQRALVARALLFDEKRSMNIMAALQAIGPVTPALSAHGSSPSANQLQPASPITDLPSSLMTTTELRTSLLCAMAIAHLHKFAPPEEPVNIYSVIKQIQPVCDMGLLGYTATYMLINRIAGHEFAADACATTLERLSGTLRIWTGKECTLEPQVREQIIKRCVALTSNIVGMNFENDAVEVDYDTDTGYGSMSDGEIEPPPTSDRELLPENDMEVIHTGCGCSA